MEYLGRQVDRPVQGAPAGRGLFGPLLDVEGTADGAGGVHEQGALVPVRLAALERKLWEMKLKMIFKVKVFNLFRSESWFYREANFVWQKKIEKVCLI